MTAQEIIDTIGGEQITAFNCKVHQTTVSKWITTERIPPDYWQIIMDISRGKITLRMLFNSFKIKL